MSSEGNILDDGAAVEVLQSSKKLSDDIAAKQQSSKKLSDDIAAKQQDKLLFAFSLATNIEIAEGRMEASQLRFLVTGALSMDFPHQNPSPDWISEQSWAHICELSGLADAFNGLRDSLEASCPSLRLNASFQLAPMPCTFTINAQLLVAVGNICKLSGLAEASNGLRDSLEITPEKLDTFQKLLVLRSLTPDKLVPAVQAYVMTGMGKRYVEPQEFKLGAIFADSAPSVPLIFVLSAGSDPMANLLSFADEKGRAVETVSLGQGQGPIAEQWITKAIEKGFWVVLQNCHLAKSFLPRLEVICEKVLSEPTVSAEFRLWLTSYPSDIFPQSILENGLKITNEPPKGLRAGLERIFKSEPLSDPAFFNGCRNEFAFRNLTYALTFFHCVVVGRRQYGPVGWNIPYTFNENDLRISLRQLRMFLDQYDDVPLAMLAYTAGECNYGGKVTDGKDRRTLSTLLDLFYNEYVVVGECNLTPSGKYVVPAPGDYKSYLDYMATLPLVEEPEVFGMHSNANISRDLQDTKMLLDSLLLTLKQRSARHKDAASFLVADFETGWLIFQWRGGESPEDTLYATATGILEKIPPNFDLETASIKYPVTYLDSKNTVLVQELGRVNVLLEVIRDSLKGLQKAVKGIVVMSQELEKVGVALASGRVPELWLTRSFPSLKPVASYVKEVVERAAFFNDWLQQGPPTVFWISGFFFTQAFLTAAKQNFARAHKIPIDLIEFDFEVHDKEGDCESPPRDGIYVKGMFIEAAGWDYGKSVLCESEAKILFVPMPPMLFLPCKTDSFKDVPQYECPLYKTSERRGTLSTTGHSTNFVCDVRIPSDQPESHWSHWVQRGLALLTSLDM
eukprot:gene21153-28042_t